MVETGDLGFTDACDDEKQKQKELEELREEEEAAAVALSVPPGDTTKSEIPVDPLFAEFTEYRKYSQPSAADMEGQTFVSLQPWRQ